MRLPFNQPFIVGKELYYIAQAVIAGQLSGNGPFTELCQQRLVEEFGFRKVLLTHSCTAALEMSALLCDVGEGDEIILPSFTFVSTANAFALRGARLKFVDICPSNMNIDPDAIRAAVTERTRVICPVHYAGVGCDMEQIMKIARDCGARVVEDAAQALGSRHGNLPLGGIGHLGALSFHETKNVISGEGGALLVNDESLDERAEFIWEKGTNRTQFKRGEVDKYTWVDLGSSYLPSELTAAFLYAQLENATEINDNRKGAWSRYAAGLSELVEHRHIEIPHLRHEPVGNGHLFAVITRDSGTRTRLLEHLTSNGVNAIFHYVPLHSSPMARKLGYEQPYLPVTDSISARLVRLPLFFGITPDEQDVVIDLIYRFFEVTA